MEAEGLRQLTFEALLRDVTRQAIRQLLDAQARLSEAAFTDKLQWMSEGARLTVLEGIADERLSADDQDSLTALRDWIIDTLPYGVGEPFAQV